jgi:hypothetical protein
MKLLLKHPSISLSFAEYKEPDTLGEELIKAYLSETFGLVLGRKLQKKWVRYGRQTSPWWAAFVR